MPEFINPRMSPDKRQQPSVSDPRKSPLATGGFRQESSMFIQRTRSD